MKSGPKEKQSKKGAAKAKAGAGKANSQPNKEAMEASFEDSQLQPLQPIQGQEKENGLSKSKIL